MSETEESDQTEVKYYDPQSDEEKTIAVEKIKATTRVLREMSELESDSDHVHAAMTDWMGLMLELYEGPYWPESQEVTPEDVESALDVAEIFDMDSMQYDISVSYNETEPKGVHRDKERREKP